MIVVCVMPVTLRLQPAYRIFELDAGIVLSSTKAKSLPTQFARKVEPLAVVPLVFIPGSGHVELNA